VESQVVLIVHSDEAVRASMRFLFEAQGWTVRSFASPIDVLGNSNSTRVVSCIAVDYTLPVMTGLHLIEELRARGFASPAILLAGHIGRLHQRAALLGAAVVDPLDGASWSKPRQPCSPPALNSLRRIRPESYFFQLECGGREQGRYFYLGAVQRMGV
jgi:CheY-like chemotaxis protein